MNLGKREDGGARGSEWKGSCGCDGLHKDSLVVDMDVVKTV